MSHQFDQMFGDSVCLYGDEYKPLIEPDSIEGLVEALDLLDEIETVLSGKMHDEDTSSLEDAIEKQKELIQFFLEDIGEFDNKILVSNITFLTKKHGIRIGDLEKMLGISAGYISRTAKENSGKKMSVDVVWKLSRIFETDIRILLEVDLNGLTPTESYYATFLNKLIRDTAADKLDWEKESDNKLNNLHPDKSGYVCHPLFSEETFYRTLEEYPEQVTDVVFTSDTFGCNTYITDDCYNLRLKNGAYIYIMAICKDIHYTNDLSAFAKELWIIDQHRNAQVICKNNDGTVLASLVDNLYDTLKAVSKQPRVKGGIKSAIDAFMSDDMEDDDDYCPY